MLSATALKDVGAGKPGTVYIFTCGAGAAEVLWPRFLVDIPRHRLLANHFLPS